MILYVEEIGTNSTNLLNSFLPLIGTLIGGAISAFSAYTVILRTQKYEKLKNTIHKMEECFWYFQKQFGKFLYALRCGQSFSPAIQTLLDQFSLHKLGDGKDKMTEDCTTVLSIELFLGKKHKQTMALFKQLAVDCEKSSAADMNECVNNVAATLRKHRIYYNIPANRNTPEDLDKWVRDRLIHITENQIKDAKKKLLPR